MIKRLFLILFILILLTGLTATYLLSSNSGFRHIEQMLVRFIPELSIERSNGTPFTQYRAESIAWNGQHESVQISDLDFTITFSALLQGTVDIKRIHSTSVVFTQLDKAKETQQTTGKIDIPVNIKISELALDHVAYIRGDQNYTLEHVMLSGDVTDNKANINHLSVKTILERLSANLQLAGQIDINEESPHQLKVSIDVKDKVIGDVSGNLTFQGISDDYQLNAEFENDSDTYAHQKLSLQASGNTKKLIFDNINLDGDQGKVMANGELAWSPVLQWKVGIQAEELKTAVLIPDYPAVLTGQLQFSGQLHDQQPELNLVIQSLTGKLNEHTLSAHGTAQYRNANLNVEQLNAQVGDNKLLVHGSVSDDLDLVWELQGKNLAQLSTDMAGSIIGSGKLIGRRDSPEIQADLSGTNLQFQQYHAKKLSLTLKQNQNLYTIHASADQLKVQDNDVNAVTVNASGKLEQHTLNLKIRHPQVDTELVIDGGWLNNQWEGIVKSLQLDNNIAGKWGSNKPAKLFISRQKVHLESMCLSQKKAQLCSMHAWDKTTGYISQGSAEKIPLAILEPVINAPAKLNGNADMDFNFTHANNASDGKINLNLEDSSLALQTESGKARLIKYRNALAELTLKDKQVTGDAKLQLIGYGNMQGNVFISLDQIQTINGNIQANLPDISWVDEFVTEAQILKGELNADIQVGGDISNPIFSGNAQISNGALRLYQTGDLLDNVTLDLISRNDNLFGVTGSLRAGDGNLNINGEISIDPKNWFANIAIKGKDLMLINTHEFSVKTEPDLSLKARPDNVAVSGIVTIPEASIRLKTLPKSAITESSDVIIINRKKSAKVAKKKPLSFQPDITLVLGDKVVFSGYGLNTRLQGKFHLNQLKKRQIYTGVLNILDGKYDAYGQVLTIDKGQLIFNGALDNPGIDIRAIRTLPDLKVGLQVNGTLQEPESSVFSDPSLSETEAFSYLLTGRSLSSASGAESALLMTAAKQLGVKGGENFIRKIGAGIGLDETSINTGRGFEESELLLGKRIGPDLYIKYIVGLIDGIQKMAVEYRFNNKLRVEAQAGAESSADLIYKIERN